MSKWGYLFESNENAAWINRLLARPWYRGTDSKNKGAGGIAALGHGIYLTWDKQMAKSFAQIVIDRGGKGPPLLQEYKLKPGLKILDTESKLWVGTKKILGLKSWDQIRSVKHSETVTRVVKSRGFDGVISDRKEDGLVLFDSKNAILVGPVLDSLEEADDALRRALRNLSANPGDYNAWEKAIRKINRSGNRMVVWVRIGRIWGPRIIEDIRPATYPPNGDDFFAQMSAHTDAAWHSRKYLIGRQSHKVGIVKLVGVNYTVIDDGGLSEWEDPNGDRFGMHPTTLIWARRHFKEKS